MVGFSWELRKQRPGPLPHTQNAPAGSESESSDAESGDGVLLKAQHVRCAALECLEVLAKWDPKSLHQVWLTILPATSMLSEHVADPTLIDAIVSDPSAKVGITSLSLDLLIGLLYP